MPKATITMEQIIKHCGSHNAKKAEPYYARGAIHNARVTGDTLKADCQGSRAAAYRVEVTCKGGRVASARCSCPVGGSGVCKHVAAVLLARLRLPDSFREVEPIETALNSYSQKELTAIIKYLLGRAPELELDLSLYLEAGHGAAMSVDQAVYRQQADLVFERAMSRDSGEAEVAEALTQIIAPAKDWIAGGQHGAATACLAGMLASMADNLPGAYYENGDADSVAIDCADWLADCWRHAKDTALRRSIIDALLAAYRLDIDVLQGVGISDAVKSYAASLADDEELTYITSALDTEVKRRQGKYDGWARGEYAGFRDELRSRAGL